jgi:hypothetical protein
MEKRPDKIQWHPGFCGAAELTVSLFRETYPREMMQALENQGAAIEEKFPGIYYVTGNTLFATQVVVTGQLSRETHSSLRILSANVQEDDIRRFLDESESLDTPGDQHNSSAVLYVSVAANESVYRNLKERKHMNKAAMKIIWKEEYDELMAEAMAEGRAAGEVSGRSKGRAESIERLLRKGKTPEEIHELLDYPLEGILRVERETLSAVE